MTGSDNGETTAVWWYILILTPMVASLVAIVAIALSTAAALTPTSDLSVYAPAYFALAIMTIPLVFLYPLAINQDAARVATATTEWSPDPERYAVFAVLTIPTGLVLSMPLSWYYLRKRQRYLDHP